MGRGGRGVRAIRGAGAIVRGLGMARHLLLRSFACTLAMGVSLTTFAQEPSTTEVATATTDAAQRFLESLAPAQRSTALRRFQDPDRLDWHYIPKPTRKGLPLRDMNDEQRTLCHHLLRACLSDSGYEKAVKIMSLENNLREGERGRVGSPLRDPLRYFLTVFGEPTTQGPWGWSLEGHHFSIHCVVRDGDVASDTPSFWGANPATIRTLVAGGPPEGTRTLEREEQLAFELVHSLDESQRKRAVIADKSPEEILSSHLSQPPDVPREGLPAREMNESQKETLCSLLKAYTDNLAKPLADKRWASIDADGFDEIYFAWAGATMPGIGHYYRIQGPSFLLEFVNVQTDPAGNRANHIHSVWRNLKGDFGVSAQ